MVLLTMTKSMVEALEKIQSLDNERIPDTQRSDVLQGSIDIQERGAGEAQISETPPADKSQRNKAVEPILKDPKVGNPISHGQVVDLSKQMKDQGMEPCRLETLLKGSRIYIPPPPPKPEPVSQLRTRQIEFSLDFGVVLTSGGRLRNTKPSWLVSAAKKKLVPTNE